MNTKVWVIHESLVVAEILFQPNLNAFEVNTLDGNLLGILFPHDKEHESRIREELASGSMNFDQLAMEWLSKETRAVFDKMKLGWMHPH